MKELTNEEINERVADILCGNYIGIRSYLSDIDYSDNTHNCSIRDRFKISIDYSAQRVTMTTDKAINQFATPIVDDDIHRAVLLCLIASREGL